ncbi:putative bifunctional diguanylate cyclase/phosphodiesterase [Actinotalea sp.]|uniref:putative bifunctional diguanylate cyclase/phosphodiesterase n=1 Tax=Actinotalea sp. TaxID=1872145 RepID=UPI003562F3C9
MGGPSQDEVIGAQDAGGPMASSAAREAEERFALLLESSPHAVLVLAVDDATVLAANSVANQTFGDGRSLEGAPLTSFVGQEAGRSVLARIAQVDAAGVPRTSVRQAVLPRSGTTPTEIRSAPVGWRGERAVMVTICDLTDRMTLERQAADLLAVEQRFRQAFDGAAIGMALVAVGPVPPPGTFLEANAAMSALVGRSPEELRALSFADITHPDDIDAGFGALRAVLSGDAPRAVIEKRYLRPDGSVVWARVTTSAVRGPDGAVLHLTSQAEDVTARKEAESALVHRAMHDSLTGLPNRAHLLDHLEAALGRAALSATVVAVLYLDIDDFKEINDSLGHTAGDEVLVQVAQRVAAELRGGDLAARLGGDELVVACSELAHPADADAIAERILGAVARPLEIAGHVLHLTVSVGVATGGADSTAVRLLRDADRAMYRAKRGGKARYEVGDATLASHAIRQIEIYDGLHRALHEDQLRLVYQPVVDLASGRVVAVEALLRWEHPARGLLAPGEFIDVAESRELIVPIGRWVLEQAARQGAAWAERYGHRAPRVWVNVSDRQVGRHDLAGSVRQALDVSGLPARLLGIELTERKLIKTGDSARADLRAVRELGVPLAIDDFGTGRTGLDYLRELPVAVLKIDRSFIDGLGADRASTALTDALITLGHGLGLSVTAEGVETEQQLAMLRGWGCDRAQGYLLSRPGSAVELEPFLAERLGPSRRA